MLEFLSCRNILEDAGWQVTGQLQDDVAVVYPYYGEYESSTHESEFLYREEQEEGMANEQVQVADYKEENWDVSEFHEYDDNVTSHFVEGVDDWSCGIIEPQCDMQLEWAGRTELQDVIGNSSDSCKTRKDELMECSGCIRNGKCEISVSDGGHLSAKNSEELIQSTLQHSHDFSAALNSKDNTDIRSLADLEPELSAEQTFTPFVGHSASKEGFEFSEIIQNCKSVNAVNVESQKFDLDFEKYSNSEALTDHKSQKHKKMGDILCPCSESRKVIGKLQNSQHVELQASQLKSSNVNLSSQYSSSNRNTEKLINVCQVLHAEESLSAELLNLHLKQETVDGSTSQAVIGQPLNFCSASSSVQESSQERSLVESCSVDEQNDKAVDSGYPNSFSVQDMDMDLTPEQVDEISTESDEILTENSEDSEYYESESSEERDHIDNNDGLLFQHHHQALYDPMVLVVENGDVANNNRDGEGNNAVAIIQPPQEPVEALDPADDLIPLLAAAEDFDNDNDIILPDDIEPFPHWLLHLLGLANPGGGDIQNYIVLPVGDGGFLLPDEGLGDIDDNDDIDASSSSSSEVSDNEGVLNDLDNNELVVLADMEEGENQVHSKVVYRLS
ncbi:hypothetical protein B7P43_G12955 [Cryptotermes secundus]|uniref:Uncharacterized protein n=1 Tax=Cryptotermes secundus TaxID=105785 RepID=A0A2J7QFV1_9NEOP|nr:hypothetical protein B7P43_G12955 [Cryptotermes secundus]